MTEPLPLLTDVRPPGDPIFARVAIVGVGLIGASLGLAIKRQWPSTLLIGVDRNDVIERATVAHIIDVGADDLGMVSGAELVVLAAPVAENERILPKLVDVIAGDALITDVGGTKRAIVSRGRELPPRLQFVGGHPMAGATVGGPEHARPDLFANRPWILCPVPGADASRLNVFVTALGAQCVEMPAEEHDAVMAFLSHLPQLTTSALMHVVGERTGVEALRLAGRGLHDTTRLASSPAPIWKDVCASNSDNVGAALDVLIETLQELRADLTRGEVLERIFESAQKWKADLDR